MAKMNNNRQRPAAGPFRHEQIEAELKHLQTLSLGGLRAHWQERFGADPPGIRSRDVLLGIFAWRIQADAYGGLDAKTQKRLDTIATAVERNGSYEPKVPRSIASGVVLTREWKGMVHKVTVTQEGYQHLGKFYGSLSDIARTITGTRWSGPRFFGLAQKSGGAKGGKAE
jgi:hypothetical protein